MDGEKLSEPTAPTKEADSKYTYTFIGWYNGETQWNFANDIVSGDVTLTAVFQAEAKEVINAGYGVYSSAWNNSWSDKAYYPQMNIAANDAIPAGEYKQVNANAILGMEGFKVKSFTKKLLKYGYVDFVASDSHDLKKRANNLGKCRDYLYKKYDERYVNKLVEGNAIEILHTMDR
jgi:uncharacterized repeat protein (TIGR02543 family)